MFQDIFPHTHNTNYFLATCMQHNPLHHPYMLISYTDGQNSGSTVTVACDQEYRLEPGLSHMAVCADGVWSAPLPRCTAKGDKTALCSTFFVCLLVTHTTALLVSRLVLFTRLAHCAISEQAALPVTSLHSCPWNRRFASSLRTIITFSGRAKPCKFTLFQHCWSPGMVIMLCFIAATFFGYGFWVAVCIFCYVRRYSLA